MTKILDVNDLLGAMEDTDHPRKDQHREAVESAVRAMAIDLANHVGITCGSVTTQLGFGGLCVHLRPAWEGQPWPEDLEPYDPEGEFEL